MTSGEPHIPLDRHHLSASDILPERGLTLPGEAVTIDLQAPVQTEQEIDDEQNRFLSDAPAGTRYTRTTGLLKGVREASKVAFGDSKRSPRTTERVARKLGSPTRHHTSRQVSHGTLSPETSTLGLCVVRDFGDEQLKQGSGAADGQLTVDRHSPSNEHSVRPHERDLALRRRANTPRASDAASAESMLKRLRPFDEWVADLPINNAVHSQPGGARAFYDNFRATLQCMADGTEPSATGWVTSKPTRRAGCSRAPQREYTDNAVIARLKECGGMRYQSATLALYFKVPTRQMTERLRRLVQEGQIRSMRAESHTLFYFPTKEELAAEEVARNEERGRIGWRSSATLRIWRQGDPELIAYTQQMANDTK